MSEIQAFVLGFCGYTIIALTFGVLVDVAVRVMRSRKRKNNREVEIKQAYLYKLMTQTMEYKGFRASVEYNAKDDVFVGKVLGTGGNVPTMHR